MICLDALQSRNSRFLSQSLCALPAVKKFRKKLDREKLPFSPLFCRISEKSLHHFSSKSMFQLVLCSKAVWFSLMTIKIILRKKVFFERFIPPCQQFHDTITVIQVDPFLNFYFGLLYQFSDLVVLQTDNTYYHLASACSFQQGQENLNTCLHC